VLFQINVRSAQKNVWPWDFLPNSTKRIPQQFTNHYLGNIPGRAMCEV
jgi:hypothetical protein